MKFVYFVVLLHQFSSFCQFKSVGDLHISSAQPHEKYSLNVDCALSVIVENSSKKKKKLILLLLSEMEGPFVRENGLPTVRLRTET